MTHWNYRIFNEPGADAGEEDFVTLREVFYDEDNKPLMYTAQPAYPSGTTVDELRADLQRMLSDLDRAPILTAQDFPEAQRAKHD